MAFRVVFRRFAAGQAASEMTSAVDPIANREQARQHADEIWMNELRRVQAEAEAAWARGERGMSAIPTGLNADMKAVTLHSEAEGVLHSTIICVERGAD